MKISLVSLSITFALASTNIQLHAQESIEKISVWGTKVKSSSVFIDDESIASKQVDHLSDLLRSIPGVDVGGTHSVNQRINVRGLDDTDLSVVIDGASQNNYMFHHTGNLLLNPDLLKSVDIQVGANSVIHSGLGGAIEFRTKEAKDLLQGNEQFGALVLAGVNSNASQRMSFVGYGQLAQDFDVLGYVSYLNKDDFEDGSGMEVLGTDGTITNSMIKLGYDVTNNQRIAFKFDAYRDDGDYGLRPDMGIRYAKTRSRTGEVELFDTHFDRDTVSAHYEVKLGQALDLRADLYQNETTFARTPSFGETQYDSSATAKNTGLTVMANSTLSSESIRHQLSYGLNWLKVDSSNRHINLSDANSELEHGTEKSDEFSLFIQDAVYFGNGFTITPGLRFNKYSKESFADGSDESWDEWQTALAAEYNFDSGLSLSASTTGLFKGPQLGEVFIYNPNGKRLNPELTPETGTNNEFKIKYRSGDILGSDEFRVALTHFDTTIDDYIDEVDYPNDECTGHWTCASWDVNVGKVEIDGFEFSLLYAIDNFDALVTFATSDSDVIHYNDAVEKTPLSRDVGDSATLTLNYDVSDYDLLLTWHLQHTRSKQIDADTVKKGYNVHTVSATWRPTQLNDLSVIFGIDNVFDAFYVSHASRTASWYSTDGDGNTTFYDIADYEPGRNIKLTVSYQF